jgi:hypothetical protein
VQVGEEFRALQQPAKSFVPLPHRNLVILALGASYACQVKLQCLSRLCWQRIQETSGLAMCIYELFDTLKEQNLFIQVLRGNPSSCTYKMGPWNE